MAPFTIKKASSCQFVKGFINGAITFEHVKRNRKNVKEKAQKVIASYERYKHLCTEEIEHASF